MDLPYPYFRLQANGPQETGFSLFVHIEEGGGGPLAGQTSKSVIDALRTRLESDDGTVTTSLTRYDIAVTDNP